MSWRRPGDARGRDDEEYTIYVRAGSPFDIAVQMYRKFRGDGDRDALRRALSASAEAIDSTGDDPKVLAEVHAVRCAVLVEVYHLDGRPEVLADALANGRRALRLKAPSDPGYPDAVLRVTEVHRYRWEREQDPGALEEAVSVLREAARLRPDRDPEIYSGLSNFLAIQAMAGAGGRAVSDEAVEAGRTALRLTTPGTGDFATRQAILGRALMVRGARGLDRDPLADVDEAVRLFRAALAITPPGSAQHAMLQGFIGSAADIRSQLTGSGGSPSLLADHDAGPVRPRPKVIVDLGADRTVRVSTAVDDEVPAADAVAVPLSWPLDAVALEELRWYLEDYLGAPYGVYEERGAQMETALATWGQAVFSAVFGTPSAQAAYRRMWSRGEFELVFRSSSPALLALPWELIRDLSRTRPLALDLAGVSRGLPGAADAGQQVAVPGGRLRVLLVISRPGGTGDVGYRMIARTLLKRLEPVRGTVDLVVLRPPTLAALRAELASAAAGGKPYQLVHFDGHGTFQRRADAAQEEGTLCFEHPDGRPDHVGAATLAVVLRDAAVPVVVLNACQSGAVGKALEAAVATRLLSEGVASVVAMAYAVFAVAAAEFMAAFYEALLAGDTVAKAVTAGRRQMSASPGRPSPKGSLPLADWVVPVHYLRRDVRFPQAVVPRPADAPSLASALEAMAPSAAEAGSGDLAAADGLFVGRDALFYELDREASRNTVVILTGPAGSGKTELAKAFGRWWQDTGGVEKPEWVLWHRFDAGAGQSGIDGIIDEIGPRVCGTGFALLTSAERRTAVIRELSAHRMLLIWDNFESVRSMPDDARNAGVRRFLGDLAAPGNGGSRVIITSRTPEEWLGDCRTIMVGGLAAHEASEYADALLAPSPAASAHRAGPAFSDLMRWLHGNPLSMRLVLPRLADATPEELLRALDGTTPLAPDARDGPGHGGSLPEAIAYSYAGLSPTARDLLPALSLFHEAADYMILVLFGLTPQAPPRFRRPPDDWRTALDEAVHVGLLAKEDNVRYRMHPALPAYLAAVWRATDPASYETEHHAAMAALLAATAAMFGELRADMGKDPALEQQVIGRLRPTLTSLLGYALDHGQWREAAQLYQQVAAHWDYQGLVAEADAWAERIRAATQMPDGITSDPDSPAAVLRLMALDMLARREPRGATSRPDTAERDALADRIAGYRPELREFHLVAREAEVAVQEGRLDQAEELYRSAMILAEALGEPQLKALAYDDLASLLANRGHDADRAEAAELLRQSLAIKEQRGGLLEIAGAHHQLAIIAYNDGDLDQAEHHARQSHARNQQGGHRPGLVSDYHLMGAIARGRGRLGQAEEWLRKALVAAGDLGNRRAAASIYAELSLVASDARRHREATQWGRRALAFHEELGDRDGMAEAYKRLALVAAEQDKLGEVIMWVIMWAAMYGELTDPATAGSRTFLTNQVNLEGIEALEEDWRTVTGSRMPSAIRDHFTARGDASHASAQNAREITRDELRRAVQDYRASRAEPR